MKRILLCLTAVLFAVVGWAQSEWKDITSDYIKNAAMGIDKDQQTDWTLVGCTDNGPSEGYNVYGFYAGWGALESTVGSAKQDITLPAGKYRMTGYAFFRQGLKFDVEPSKSLGKMIAGEESAVIPTLGSVSGLDPYPDNFPQAADAFYNKNLYQSTLEFTLSEDKTITVGFECTFDLQQSWMLIGEMKLYREMTILDEYKLVRESLKSLQTEGLNAGLMEKVNATLTETENMVGSDEELNSAISMMRTTKTEVEEVLPKLKEIEEYLVSCENVISISTEKRAGVTDAFKEALKTSGLESAVTPEDFAGVKTVCENAYIEYILNAVPNQGEFFDYTIFIEGIGNSTNGWVNEFTGFNKNYQYNGASNKNNGASGLIKPGYIEAWNNGVAFTGTLIYTKNNLPTGIYKLSAYAFKNDGATVNFTANGQTVALQDAGGLYTNPVLENIEVTDGSLTFGLEMIEKADWIGITNIKLSYIGLLGIDKLKVSLEEARTALQAAFDVAVADRKIGKAMKAKVEELMAATGTVDDDAIALTDACSKVIAMTNSLSEITEAYAKVGQQIKDAMMSAMYATVDNPEDKTNYTAAYTKANTDLEEAVTLETIQVIGTELAEATKTFVLVAYPGNGKTFDYTFMIENPSFETGGLSPWTAANGGDTGVKENSNGTYNITNAHGDYVFNTWGTSNMHVQQTVTGLRDGVYKLTALVAADAGTTLTLTAGVKTANVAAIDKATGVDVSVDGVEVVNGELLVKVASSNWFKADNFRLEYTGKAIHTEVPEALAPAPESEGLDEIGYIEITASGQYAVINAQYDDEGYIETLNCEMPYLLNKETKEKIEVSGVDYGEGYNTIMLMFATEKWEPITASGTYELVIPQGLYSCPDNKEDWEGFVLSGPQNKEVRYEYTIVEHQAGPVIEIIGVEPASEDEVETVSTFTLAFDQPVTINTSEDAPAVYLMSRLSGQISATVSAVEGEGQENQILITLEREVADAGMYTLVVPEKVVLNAQGDWNVSVNLTYRVTGKKVETTNYQPTGITPAEGEVTSLKSFVLQFQKETFAVTNVDSQEEAYLINKDTQEKVSATLDMGDEYNEIKIELTEEVTAKGSYTLVVPAMKIQQASDSWGNNVLDNAPELRYDFTVVEGQSIDAVLAKGQRVDVYTVSGLLVKKAADREALKTLKKGLYVINGKGVLIK